MRRIPFRIFFFFAVICWAIVGITGCRLFEQPESSIATLDLNIPVMTLTAAAPTATIDLTPPAPTETIAKPEDVQVLLIPFTEDEGDPTKIPTSTPKTEISAENGVYDRNGALPTHPAFRLAEIPEPRSEEISYSIVSGDTISALANLYQVPVSAIVERNQLKNPETIQIGQALIIPAIEPEGLEIADLIISDQEIIYGPSAFEPENFLAAYPRNILSGYIESTPTPMPTQDGDKEIISTPDFTPRSGIEILKEVALENSINPRVLIALMEYQTQTISNEKPKMLLNESYIGALGWRTSLDHQLSWTANTLNYGFYQWKNNRLNQWILADDSVIAVDPSVNAGTAALQYLFSKLYGKEDWLKAIGPDGFRMTFESLFGANNDASWTLIDEPKNNPQLTLPFAPDEDWYYSSGPHYGWANGSPWSAVDFVPGDAIGCSRSDYQVTAAADGLVIYSDNGLVVVDLDFDGDVRTGWLHLYLHVGERDRVKTGARLKQGDFIGHASCEGGFSSGTHLHFARRYNGQWVPIDADHPLILSGFEVFSTGDVYDGYLVKDDQVVEAWYFQNDANRIVR